MKVCLGQKVKISLPKAFQTAKPKKSLVVKGVPAEVTEQEFKEFQDGRVLEIFKLEIKDDTEAKALIIENLTYPITGIIYRVEEFRTQFPYSSAGTAKVSDIRPKLVGLKPNALSVGRAIIITDAQIKRKNSQNVPTVKDHMLHPTKSIQHTKNRHLGNMWWTAKNHMPQFYAKPQNPRIRLSHFRLNNLQNS